jgi:hypothetical protein
MSSGIFNRDHMPNAMDMTDIIHLCLLNRTHKKKPPLPRRRRDPTTAVNSQRAIGLEFL